MYMHHTKAYLSVVLLVLPAISTVAQYSVKRTPVRYCTAASGEQLYRNNCAPCHGNNMKGNGPAAMLTTPASPDLTRIAARNQGKFPHWRVYEDIARRDQRPETADQLQMPSWQRTFHLMYSGASAKEMQALQNLVRYLEAHQE